MYEKMDGYSGLSQALKEFLFKGPIDDNVLGSSAKNEGGNYGKFLSQIWGGYKFSQPWQNNFRLNTWLPDGIFTILAQCHNLYTSP